MPCTTPLQSMPKATLTPSISRVRWAHQAILPLHQSLHHYLEKHGKRASPSEAIYGILLRSIIMESQIIYHNKILECLISQLSSVREFLLKIPNYNFRTQNKMDKSDPISFCSHFIQETLILLNSSLSNLQRQTVPSFLNVSNYLILSNMRLF